MSTTLPSQLLGSVASAAGSGLDAASHLVADATESLGDIAGAAIDVGGSAAGVIADNTARGARKAWSVAPGAIAVVRRHPVLAASGAAVLVTCFVLARRRRDADHDAFGDVASPAPGKTKATTKAGKVKAVDAA